MGLFSSKSKSTSTSTANEIVTAAEGNNPQPTTLTATTSSDAIKNNLGVNSRLYKSSGNTFSVDNSSSDSYTSNDTHTNYKNAFNKTTRYSNSKNRRYEDSFNRAHNSYNRDNSRHANNSYNRDNSRHANNSYNRAYTTTSNTSNKTVNRTTNDSNNTIGSTIFGRSSSAWNRNTLGAYAKVNSGNTSYTFRDRGNVYINQLPPLFDKSFGDGGDSGDFERKNDDTKNMNNNFSVRGAADSNPFTQTTGNKDTSNATDQKSDGGMISKYVWIAAAAAGAYMLLGGNKRGRSSGRGLALGRSSGRGLALR